MQIITTELIQKLKEIAPLGYEVSLRMGTLTITKDVFYKRNRFYVNPVLNVYKHKKIFCFYWLSVIKTDLFKKEPLVLILVVV